MPCENRSRTISIMHASLLTGSIKRCVLSCCKIAYTYVRTLQTHLSDKIETVLLPVRRLLSISSITRILSKVGVQRRSPRLNEFSLFFKKIDNVVPLRPYPARNGVSLEPHMMS